MNANEARAHVQSWGNRVTHFKRHLHSIAGNDGPGDYRVWACSSIDIEIDGVLHHLRKEQEIDFPQMHFREGDIYNRLYDALDPITKQRYDNAWRVFVDECTTDACNYISDYLDTHPVLRNCSDCVVNGKPE